MDHFEQIRFVMSNLANREWTRVHHTKMTLLWAAEITGADENCLRTCYDDQMVFDDTDT